MPLVLVSFSNGIDTITLNNPKKRNALSTDNLAARIAENSPLVVSVFKEQLRVISEAVPLNPEGF